MNVEKFIITLGYIVYTALWLPVIVLALPITFIVWLVTFTRLGVGIKTGMNLFRQALVHGVRHDMEFIRTGKWY